MRVLPDTPIWSAAFRRTKQPASPHRRELEKLIRHDLVEMIGPIRQELLSGIKEDLKFEQIRRLLQPFPDIPLTTQDHEDAAAFYNRCRAVGIQGSGTDFLICALAVRHGLAIYTDDRDFLGYQKVLPINLHYPTD